MTVLGPRQSGKTTLARMTLPELRDLSVFQRFLTLLAGRVGQARQRHGAGQ
ncbi:MAG: hypothetical protein IPK64_00510 [bacterium]|nr:hypothetical protein [bacterium]